VNKHLTAIFALLPRGKIWPLEEGDAANMDALFDAAAQEPDRVQQDADDLLSDLYPDVATQSLPDWERILGLTSAGLTAEQRRAQILGQLRRRADPTIANITIAAQSWGPGIVVEHQQYHEFRMGVGVMGDPLRGDAWLTVVTISYPGPASTAFEAAMRASVPLHCTIIFVVI
jgi:uncharacterized protein YmfQ (DUF2313 family)